MNFRRKLLTLFLFTIIYTLSFAQSTDSCHVRISLITCAPGQELYSTFGHTAIRITDTAARQDLVYNYGTFVGDFNDPAFYLKFIRGKLEYVLSVNEFADFMAEYQYEQRSVQEQILLLDCGQKQQIIDAINTNMQAVNRAYKYDFLYDNCTTRVRDLLFSALPKNSLQKRIVEEGTTSRNLIHNYLDAGGEPWSKLGIDILLGAKLDVVIDAHDAMFLPEYLLKGIDSARVLNASSVLHKATILNILSPIIPTGKDIPFIAIGLACCVIMLVYMLPHTKAKAIAWYIDSFLLYITGLLGCILLFMWFGTDHTVCQQNYNLLWALPTNLVAAIFLSRRPAWLRTYFGIAFVIYALLLLTWFWLPQQINPAIAPVVMLLLYRYTRLMRKPKAKKLS